MTLRIDTKTYGFPQTWLGRIVGGVLAMGLLILAFFFIFLFLVTAGILILGIALRLLWIRNRLRTHTSHDVIEGEYSVDPRDAAANITHKT
jgi:hypothetical protein